MMLRTGSKFLHHTACDACGSSDALGHYSDGGQYCFSCGYTIRPNISGYVREVEVEPEKIIKVPSDISNEYSEEALQWCNQYGIGVDDLIKHRVKWSKYYNQLIFIYEKVDHKGIGVVQARNFTPGARKYFNQGDMKEVLPIYHHSDDEESLVIVEDAISAIKVSRQYDAMPLLGSSLMLHKVPQIKRAGYRRVVMWLDHDKYKEAQGIATKFQLLGLSTYVMATDLDPKCYPDDEIKYKLKVVKDLE